MILALITHPAAGKHFAIFKYHHEMH